MTLTIAPKKTVAAAILIAAFAFALVCAAGTARQMRAHHLPMVVRTHWE